MWTSLQPRTVADSCCHPGASTPTSGNTSRPPIARPTNKAAPCALPPPVMRALAKATSRSCSRPRPRSAPASKRCSTLPASDRPTLAACIWRAASVCISTWPTPLPLACFPALSPAQVRVVGNTSLGGALLAALDRDALPAMEELRARIQIVELNQHPRFEDRYLDHLALP
ncbi:DUF4445 domain-containing protein [Opitutaceae bacterium TAV3]|nr:DUF4445 domain-containing protein [Opitutaceae bacterium TAV3]